MSHHFALLSLVLMIVVVLMFERVHLAGLTTRFCKTALLSGEELNRILNIVAACQEA